MFVALTACLIGLVFGLLIYSTLKSNSLSLAVFTAFSPSFHYLFLKPVLNISEFYLTSKRSI